MTEIRPRRRIVVGLSFAVVCFALFLTLGRAVGQSPDPPWMMALESSWVNHSTLIAWWFTWLGYVYVLVPVCVLLLVCAVRFPSWRWRIFFSIVMLLICWQAADVFQHFFARPRRLDWVVKHEVAFGFPSSHAAIATGFYVLWASFLLRSALPRRVLLAALVAAVALAIMWSRLAVAAHYLTDIVGGVLLAAAVVAFCSSVLPINVFAPKGGRP